MQIALWYISKDEYVSLYIQRLFLLDIRSDFNGSVCQRESRIKIEKATNPRTSLRSLD